MKTELSRGRCCFHEHVDYFPDGTAAACGFCDVMSRPPNLFMSIGACDGKAYTLEYFYVGSIVANKGTFVSRHIGLGKNFFESKVFLVVTLLDEVNAELSTAEINDRRFAAGNDARSESSVVPDLQSLSIADI